MRRIAALLTFILFTTSFISNAGNDKKNIVPTPQRWVLSGGDLSISNVRIIKPDEDSAGLFSGLLGEFEKELSDMSQISVTTNSEVYILFEYINDTTLGDEGYRLIIEDNIKVLAQGYSGMLYATRTILQLLSQSEDKQSLPKGVITDYPEYKIRMLMLDVGRKFIPFADLKDYIRSMAWVKLNELHLHLNDNSFGHYPGYRLESEAYPELTNKDGFYTWEQIRELQDFAHIYGITITPEIDSPGHSLAFTKVRPDLKSPLIGEKYLDILNPESFRFMETIISEVIPHFDAPDFHIGTDEYRLYRIKDKELRNQLGEKFRQYITYFNAYVRGKGKNCRIWSGYEHMPGTTEPDVSTIIDMWETSDAKSKSEAGYKFINSSHYYTYIVPGAPYYGVDDAFVYNKWTPEKFSNKEEQNLEKGAEGLLGSGLHIWTDFGPSGYTSSEIARLSFPSMITFSEKMWGTKGFENYKAFEPFRDEMLHIPLTSLLNRNFEEKKQVFKGKNLNLKEKRSAPMETGYGTENLEYPWTVTMTLKRGGKSEGNEVLLSSDLSAIYSDLKHVYENKKKKEKVTKRGIAVVRSNKDIADVPLNSFAPDILVFNYQLPVGKSVKVKLVGEKKKTSLYINGKLIESYNIQSVCPLVNAGSNKENVFNGTISKIEIVNYVK